MARPRRLPYDEQYRDRRPGRHSDDFGFNEGSGCQRRCLRGRTKSGIRDEMYNTEEFGGRELSKTTPFRTLTVRFRWLGEATACRWRFVGLFGSQFRNAFRV